MRIKIGTITKPIGLKGEVRVYSDSEFKEIRFKKGQKVTLVSQSQEWEMKVLNSSISGNFVKVLFDGIYSIDEAERFRQVEVYLNQNDLHDLNEDEFYFFELKGCQIFEDDELIGTVEEVRDYPASAMLVIQTSTKQFYLPFVKQFILHVDLSLKRIDVKLIEGFL